ncbi:MAG TPA: hypothetical protein VM734_30740 [Kofleriaceae bacterium]|jgi:hypothetical protein|nr:hypothetical protein [Kofleriaceae bacterium]
MRTTLAVLALLAVVVPGVAAAAPLRPLGLDFPSSEWTVFGGNDGTSNQVTFFHKGATLLTTVAVRPISKSDDCAAYVRNAGPGARPLSGRLAHLAGFVDNTGVGVCRASRGRKVMAFTKLPAAITPAQETALLGLLDDLDRALRSTTSLTLYVTGLDLGPRFDRWHATALDGPDLLQLVNEDEPLTLVSVERSSTACRPMTASPGVEVKPRPAHVPAAFHGQVSVGWAEETYMLSACLPHGSASYLIDVGRQVGAGRAPSKSSDAAVGELLRAIADAVAKTPVPAVPDEVSGASEEADDDVAGDDGATRAAPPAVTPDAPPAIVAEPVTATASATEPAATTTATATTGSSRARWRGRLPTSPVLSLGVRRLGQPATDMTAARSALGAALTVTRPLWLVDGVAGVEWSGAIGYDELSGVAFDLRGGGGIALGAGLFAIGGVGIDGWTGDVALPTQPYLYLGGTVGLGPLALRAEYLPRNGGTDEKRLHATFTRFRDEGRKLAVGAGLLLVDGARALTIGVGVGI